MRVLLSVIALFLLAGCGATVRHNPRAIQPVGTTLPIEVSHTFDRDADVSGVVHYRMPGSPTFAQAALQMRGTQLWTMLPTEDLAPDEWVEYYIDVDGDGSLYALGSPGRPFQTTFLDRTGMIIAGLHATVHASDTSEDVVIVLNTRGAVIDQPIVEYFMPDVPGIVRAPMDADPYGNFVVVIPAHVVRAGTWRYAIDMEVEGLAHRIPETGFGVFDVNRAERAETVSHLADDDG